MTENSEIANREPSIYPNFNLRAESLFAIHGWLDFASGGACSKHTPTCIAPNPGKGPARLLLGRLRSSQPTCGITALSPAARCSRRLRCARADDPAASVAVNRSLRLAGSRGLRVSREPTARIPVDRPRSARPARVAHRSAREPSRSIARDRAHSATSNGLMLNRLHYPASRVPDHLPGPFRRLRETHQKRKKS